MDVDEGDFFHAEAAVNDEENLMQITTILEQDKGVKEMPYDRGRCKVVPEELVDIAPSTWKDKRRHNNTVKELIDLIWRL